jgi:hypothetical protein
MKKVIQLLVFIALVSTLALSALAQATPSSGTASTAASAQDDAEAKVKLYDQFRTNIKEHPDVAYQAGKDYLAKYEAKDGPTDQYIAYIKKWVASYEKVVRRTQLFQQIGDKKYNEAFASAKQVLMDYPDDVDVLYRLVGAGVFALNSKNEANNADAIAYTKKLISLVQAGKNPDSSKSKDEVLGNLNYALGLFSQKSQPTEAAGYFVTAAQFEGGTKKDPNTYLLLADIYEKGDYTTLATQFSTNCKTPEQLNGQECKDLSTKVNQVVDHIIDALARAIAYSNSSPDAAKFAADRASWMEALTRYYKYRNNDSDAGLKELIASITSRPIPKPGEAIVPPLIPQASTPPSSSSTTTTQPTATPATKQGTTPATTTQPGSKTTTTPPAGKTSTGKTTPRRSH